MILRSITFYILLGFWTIFLGLICLIFLILPSQYLYRPAKLWIGGIFFLLKYICNITHEIKGLENIPNDSVLIASKHQSAFETFALFYYLPKAIFIHKKQLFWIPVFGQYLKKINMISIDRKKGASSMRLMLKKTKEKTKLGFSIIIFPEGTRKKPGDKPDYKSGFVGMYKQINKGVLPVALNSGNFWPKDIFIKKSGHITINFLEIIPPGLEKNKILTKLETAIENKIKEMD